jgi:Mu transposase, C-terminal domain/Phosphoesterase family
VTLSLPPVAPTTGWRASLHRVRAVCDGRLVADHERIWAWHQTISDPGQGSTAADGPSDQFGPSTRIPALIIGGNFTRSGVDHQAHDTTSILATLERQYGFAPLGTRDKQVTDLRHALIVGGNR